MRAPEAPIDVTATPRLPAALARWAHWIKPGSIRLRLSAVFALFLLLVLGLGAFGIQRLAEVNRVSDEIRNHWLQDTRLLGDLNNYMSDYRTAEGTHLLSTSPMEIVGSEKRSLRSTPRSRAANEATNRYRRIAPRAPSTTTSPSNGLPTRGLRMRCWRYREPGKRPRRCGCT